jgi:thioredoxin reductase (NADPH)
VSLAGCAYVQAQKFGAEILTSAQATSLDCGKARSGEWMLRVTDARSLRSRTAVIASGARASPLEAKLCAGEEIAIIGGGNSAGQAAVFLANHASRVHMLIRGKGLAASSVARRLSRETAQSPAKAVEHLRVKAARVLIEQGRLSMDAVAEGWLRG